MDPLIALRTLLIPLAGAADSGKKVVAATFQEQMDLISGYQVFPCPISSRLVVDGRLYSAFWNVWRWQGFNLAADFSPAPGTTTDQFTNANQVSFKVLQKTTPLDSFWLVELTTVFKLACDTNDNSINYDTLPSSMRTKVSNLDLSVYPRLAYVASR